METKKVTRYDVQESIIRLQNQLDEMFGQRDCIHFYAEGCSDDPFEKKNIKLVMSWCSIGECSLDKAAKFASVMAYGAQLAREWEYNGYEIVY